MQNFTDSSAECVFCVSSSAFYPLTGRLRSHQRAIPMSCILTCEKRHPFQLFLTPPFLCPFQVKSGPRREELVGGSVVMGEGSAGPVSSGNGRGGGKETERERLARRLKERSHSRRAGSKGTKPGR